MENYFEKKFLFDRILFSPCHDGRHDDMSGLDEFGFNVEYFGFPKVFFELLGF